MPYLTHYIRTLILAALVDSFEKETAIAARPLGVIDGLGGRAHRQELSKLKELYEEVSSGNYDADEIIRRLRFLEENGVNVPSIAYPVFRLPSSGVPSSFYPYWSDS